LQESGDFSSTNEILLPSSFQVLWHGEYWQTKLMVEFSCNLEGRDDFFDVASMQLSNFQRNCLQQTQRVLNCYGNQNSFKNSKLYLVVLLIPCTSQFSERGSSFSIDLLASLPAAFQDKKKTNTDSGFHLLHSKFLSQCG